MERIEPVGTQKSANGIEHRLQLPAAQVPISSVPTDGAVVPDQIQPLAAFGSFRNGDQVFSIKHPVAEQRHVSKLLRSGVGF